MAAQSISNPLKRGLEGAHVATTSDIAYTTKEVQSGYITVETIDVSLDAQLKNMMQETTQIKESLGTIDKNNTVQSQLQKIQEDLENISNNNSSSLSPEVQAQIEQIIAQINTINSSVTSAQSAASQAGVHLTEVKEQVKTLSELSDSIQQDVSKIDGLTEIANNLKSSFDVDARMQILSQESYDSLSSKDANTMYFIYENN